MKNKLGLALLLCLFFLPVSAQENAAWAELNAQAKTHLKNLIKIDTSSANPDEISAARYIYKEFASVAHVP